MKNYQIKINTIVLLLFFFQFYPIIVFPQPNIENQSQIIISGSVGIAKNLVNQRIGYYPLTDLLVMYPISDRSNLVGGIEYFQTKYELPYETFQYKEKIYQGMFGQLWTNYSAVLGVTYYVSQISVIGILFSLEKIDIKEVKPEWQNYRPPFTVDPYSDLVYYFNITNNDHLLVPGLTLFTAMDLFQVSNFVPFLDLQFKLQFVGEKYGRTIFNTQNRVSLGVGVKYKF